MSHAPAHARWAAFAPGVARRATAAGIGPDAIGELWSRYDDPLVEMPELGPIAVSLARFYASSPGHLQQLYDLDADPSTLRDVAAEHPDVVRALASQLRASLAEHEALRPSLAEHEEGSTGRAGVDDAALERLVELGYIDGK